MQILLLLVYYIYKYKTLLMGTLFLDLNLRCLHSKFQIEIVKKLIKSELKSNWQGILCYSFFNLIFSDCKVC